MKKCMSVVATVLAFAFSFLILTVVPISPIWGMIVGVFVGGTVFLSTYIVSRGRDPLRILFVAGLVVATLVISIVHDGQEFVFLRVTFGSATVVLFLATMLALGLSRQTTAATVVAAFILMTPNGVIGQEQLVLADMPHHQQDKSIIEILAGVAVIGLVFGFIINIGIGAKKKCDQMANSATNRIMNEIITEREVVVTNFFLVSSEFGITNQIYPPPWPTNLGRYDMIITNTVTNVVQVSYLPYGTTTNDWSDGSYVVTVASVFNAHPSITMEQEPEDGGNLTPCEFETHLNDLGLSANNMSWSSGGTSIWSD
jgi:hypothetical protein